MHRFCAFSSVCDLFVQLRFLLQMMEIDEKTSLTEVKADHQRSNGLVQLEEANKHSKHETSHQSGMQQ